jgi:hypothetical protein
MFLRELATLTNSTTLLADILKDYVESEKDEVLRKM